MDLPPEMAVISLMQSVEMTLKPDTGEVPVFTAEDAKASMNPHPKPGTVDSQLDMSMASGMVSAMTPEATLPEPLRSIIDPDRTVGMNDEELPALDADKTIAEATILSAPDPGDTSIPDHEGSQQDVANSSGKPSKSSSGSGRGSSSMDQFSPRMKATESSLNIQPRLIARETASESETTGASPDYELKWKLGEGGMGEVWLATQLSLNREVALKQIRADSLGRMSERKIETARHSFLAEAVVTGDLNHPNIVPVYDMGMDEAGNLLYSMKCVRGTSWDRLIQSLPESENIEILRKVADAIGFAHSRGVVHRDLKPSNIMVGSYGEVLVMDWGTALPLPHFSKNSGMRTPSGRAGTPAYMPPEQAEGQVEKIGPHSDIYLLGAILFEIVSGFPPHPIKNDTGGSLTTRELLENAFANRIVHTDASGELLEISMKAMKSAPRDRYPSVDKFIEALKNYQKHAESVMMVHQAKNDLEAAKQSGDYTMYARAIYGFENALSLWESNFDAKTRLGQARSAYCDIAYRKENYDLALTLVDKNRLEDRKMYDKIIAARTERDKRVARLRTMRWTAALLLVALFVGGAGAFGVISFQYQQTLLAKNEALKNKEQAEKNEQIALHNEQIAKDNEKEANNQRQIAVMERQAAEEQRKIAVMEKKAADEQRVIAEMERKRAEDQTQIAVMEKKTADEQRMIAVTERKKADDQREIAVMERKTADQQREIAVGEKKRADEQREIAQRAKTAALKEWYTSQIQLGGRYVNENNFDGARQVIAAIDAKLKSDDGKDLATMHETEFQRLKQVCSLSDNMLGLGDGKKETFPLTAVAAGNQLVATANDHDTLRVWKIASPQAPETTITISGRATALAFTPNDALLVVGNQSGHLAVWDTKTGESKGELPPHAAGVTHLFFLSGNELISTSRDKTTRVWDVENKKFRELKGHSDSILSIAKVVGSDSKTVGFVTGDSNRGELLYWKLPLGAEPKSIKLLTNDQTAFTALAAQLRGRDNEYLMVFAGGEDGSIRAFEYEINSLGSNEIKRKTVSVTRLKKGATSKSDFHSGSVSSLLIDPSNPGHLISASQDGTGRLWNIAQAALMDEGENRGLGPEEKRSLLLNELRGHGNAIIDAVAWKDAKINATRVLTISADGTARLWQPDTFPEIETFGGKPLTRTSGAYGEVLSLSVGGKNKERVIGVSTDGIATIWTLPGSPDQPAPAAPIALKEGHHFPTQSAQFLKNLLLTTSFDGSAAIWDTVNRGSMLTRLPDVGSTGLLAGSSDGRWAITGYAPASSSDKNNFQVWSLQNAIKQPASADSRTILQAGETVRHNEKLDDDSPSIATVSASGNWGVIGTENGYLNLIDLSSTPPTIKKSVPAHVRSDDPNSRTPEGVTGVAFLSDTEVASTGLDGNLRFWQVDDGNLIADPARATLKHLEGKTVHRIVSLIAAADGKRLVCRLRDGHSKEERSPDFHQIWVSDVGVDGATTIAKLQAWGEIKAGGNNVASVSISPDGQKILATVMVPVKRTSASRRSKQAVLREWNLAGGTEPTVQDVMKAVEGFDFQQATYMPGSSDEIVIISDTLTSVRKRSNQGSFGDSPVAVFGPSSGLQACDVSQDGTLAVTVSDAVIPATDNGQKEPRLQGEIRVWNVTDSVGERVGRTLVNGPIRTIAINPTNSNTVLVAGNIPSPDAKGYFAAELYRWDGRDLTRTQNLGQHRDGIIRARFSEDGKRIMTASSDGIVELFEFDGTSFNALRTLNLSSADRKIPLRELVAVDLNYDGSLIAAADSSSAIVIDVASGESILSEPMQGHSRDLTEIRFSLSPDPKSSNRIWTTSKDGTIKFWGVDRPAATDDGTGNSARLLLTLRGHQRGVLALAALPNGGVVSAGEDGQVIHWPVAQTN